jgi:Small-conductance mechanosensitive channel
MWMIGQIAGSEVGKLTDQAGRYGQMAMDAAVLYAPKVVIAAIVALVGWKLANLLSRGLHRLLENKRVDPSLRPFLRSMLDAAIKAALVITIISYLGIPTASFVAVIGAAGLAVGLALSGTLQNFAGGVVLLMVRPFRVGDLIKAQSFEGTVKEIQIFQTIIVTPDNLTVFIPNGKLMNESILNYSSQGTRRADLTFGIGYGDDVDQARKVLLDIVAKDGRILTLPAPAVVVQNLGESSVDLQARIWVATADHFKVSCEVRENVKKAFDAAGISFPFPQRDYHIIESEKPATAGA